MIRATVAVLCLAASLGAAQDTASSAGSNPRWLTALIKGLQREPVANPPASIARYDYRGEVVYYLPPRCCDIPSNVYSAAGAIICHADGGIAGDGDGRCPDFYAARKNEKIIWRDRRGARPPETTSYALRNTPRTATTGASP